MKKIILMLACFALILCACGGPDTTQTTAPTQGQTQPAETQPAPAESQAAATEAPTEATTQHTESQDSPIALAQTCIGKSVEELYALIGEPESSDYAPSCLGDGEDGNLYYDGFLVYTYREGDTETVRYVE